MGGEHRADLGAGEELGQRRRLEPGLEGAPDGVREAARARRGAGDQVGARAPRVVLVLGDVGQVREVAEGAHHVQGLVARERIERRLELAARLQVVVAAKADRALADVFDALEHRLALLGAHRVTENPPQVADVLAQRRVLVGLGGVGDAGPVQDGRCRS